jgi:hypothetical protein
LGKTCAAHAHYQAAKENPEEAKHHQYSGDFHKWKEHSHLARAGDPHNKKKWFQRMSAHVLPNFH